MTTPPQHPHEHIAHHYRQQIRDQHLKPGDRLPSVRDIAAEHGVAGATARNALTTLRLEGWINTTQRGSFVADPPATTASAHDQLTHMRRTGTTLATGENRDTRTAETVVPPAYVCAVFDMPQGSRAVRREHVVTSGARRMRLEVDWHPVAFLDDVPELLHTGSSELLPLIERRTGRVPARGEDWLRARAADRREAGLLGVKVGAAVLAVVHAWADDLGVIVYREMVVPPGVDVGYAYGR